MNTSQVIQLHPASSTGLRGIRRSGTVIYHLMRADLYERTRRYSFLITLGAVVFVAYLYLPPKDAVYLTLGLGDYRGIYNSAWIGSAMAVLCSVLLSLPAFYLVKDALERDERTRVGQILATTPLTRPSYTLGKALSNFVFLAVAVGVIALAGLGMQLIRAEDFRIDLWALFAPFIFCVLPAMAMIAAIAILFETISWLRSTFGNIVYFFLWLAILIATAAVIPSNPRQVYVPANDMWGVSIIASSMMKDTAAVVPDYSRGVSISAAVLRGPLHTFVWEGIRWTPEIVLGRLVWFGAAIGLSLFAAIFFRRFDPAPVKLKTAKDRSTVRITEREGETYVVPENPPAPIQLSPLLSRSRFRPVSLLVAELRVMLKGMRWWWFLVALGLVLAGLFTPANVSRQLLLVTWLWPLPLWSSLGSREAQYGTCPLVFSAPRLLRELPVLWLTGVVISFVTGSGVAINFLMAGEWAHLLTWGTAALFIPALALALGVWSGSNKLFEVIYMIWWYAGPVNRVPFLDFMGVGEQVDTASVVSYGLGAVVLLALAVLGRRHQTRTI